MSKELGTPTSEEKAVDESVFPTVDVQPVRRRAWWKLGGRDQSFVSVNSGYPNAPSSAATSDTKLVSTDDLHNVWETGETQEIYKPIEGYEGAHRFDPSFKWDPQEEKRLVRIVSIN